MADEGESASLSIMSSMLETTPTDRGELVIQQGELAGRRYSFEAVVCQDPTCDCEHVTLKCFTERSEEHTSELQSRLHLVCRLLLEKKNNIAYSVTLILR